MHFLRYYLWIAPNVLLGLFFFLFLRRKLYQQLPSLAIYCAVSLLEFLGAVICNLLSPFPFSTYAWILVIGDGLTAILAVWVIYELASRLVFPRLSLPKFGRRLFSVALTTLVLGAAALSGTLADFSVHRVAHLFEAINFSSALIEAGLLLVLLVFSRVLSIPWRSWWVGIALGFGVSSSFNLASAAWRAVYGRVALIPVDIVQMTGFHICVLIWLLYLVLPDRPSPPPGSKLHKEDLEAWSEQMEKIVH
jgi:hypothetical protein